jgi:DNA transposition AAA+ family ATPase
MSLRGKDFRCEIDADLHDKLRKMADLKGVELSSLGAELLEKMIVAEFHAVSIFAERVARSGISRKDAEQGGDRGK